MTDIYDLSGMNRDSFEYQALIRMPVFKLFMQLRQRTELRLTATETWVLASIIWCNHREWPTSRNTLSRISGASLAGVTKALKKLVSAKLITKQLNRDAATTGHLATRYTPTPTLLALDGDSQVTITGAE